MDGNSKFKRIMPKEIPLINAEARRLYDQKLEKWEVIRSLMEIFKDNPIVFINWLLGEE